MKRTLCVLIITLLVVVDQLVKIIIDLWLKAIGRFEVLENVLSLTYVENRGAAFGMMQNQRTFFIILTSVVLLAGLVYMLSGKIKSNFILTSVVMVIAGGIGNLIDRIFRTYVIDYIEVLFVNFAVFNFADILVTVGAFMLIAWLAVDAYKDLVKTKKEKEQAKLEGDLKND